MEADLECGSKESEMPQGAHSSGPSSLLASIEDKPQGVVGSNQKKFVLQLIDHNIVDWDGPDDPARPSNFPRWRKWLMTMSTSSLTATFTFSSSIFSAADEQTAKEFDVSSEVMILATSLFLVGFGIGPILWAPSSELWGRKIPIMTGFFIFSVFQIPVAVAQNLETIMVCRFFQGFGGSALTAVVGGMLADFWDPRERGFAMPNYAAALFAGPTFGPIVGAFIVESHLGWRWTQWITLIMCAVFGILVFISLPETYAPVLLTRRARKLRYRTKNWALHSLHEEREVDWKEMMNKYLLRPVKMLVLEPILSLITIYMAFVFGLLYLFFESYPISFQLHRGMSAGVASLPFISLLIGVLLGCLLLAFTTRTWLAPDPQAGRSQETRLLLMIFGGICLPAGLFWFAWTSSPAISPWPEIISGVVIGFGIILINLQALNYIIDCYTMNANSAIAANTLVRSFVGAGFPLFAGAMYDDLGVAWATSVLAFIAVALVPVPVVFYKYGPKIRTWSRYVPT